VVKVSQIKFKGDLKTAVNLAVEEIGGWEKFIRPGEKVLLKPNFNTADPYPASTDLIFLQTIVDLVLASGAGEVIVADSCTLALKTKDVMAKLGVYALEKIPKVRVVNFDEGQWVKKNIDEEFLGCVQVPKILDEMDKLILLPCLKTHFIAQYTGALKLAVGLMKPVERLALHIGRVQEKVAELNKIIIPDVVIMDARKCFINRGPSEGPVREPNLILASTGRVAIDIAGVNIIKTFTGNSLTEHEAENLAQIRRARQLGIE